MAGKIAVRILAGVGGLVVLGVVLAALNGPDAPVRTSTGSTPAVAPVAIAPAELTQTAVSGLGEGRWEIGTDVAPGKYRTTGPSSDVFPLCSWSVLTADGSVKDIGNSRGPSTFTVPNRPGQLFETSGCEPWTKA